MNIDIIVMLKESAFKYVTKCNTKSMLLLNQPRQSIIPDPSEYTTFLPHEVANCLHYLFTLFFLKMRSKYIINID